MKAPSLFGLADCNNFYASCERVFNPSLRNHPVVVLSNNDGCVIARSAEAKDMGIRMGTPAFKIRDLIEKHNIAVFSSNYTLYGDMSARVMTTLSRFTPGLEVYSIDEAFLDLSPLAIDSLENRAQEIREVTGRATGIPISIGIAPTKTLAKMANKLAKADKTLNGICLLTKPEEIGSALKKVLVKDIWGIGPRYGTFLEAKGIRTAHDFTQIPDEQVKKNFTIMGLRAKRELLGEACFSIETTPPTKKAICTARSFGSLLSDLPSLEEAVAAHASSCGTKLRQEKSCASVVMVFIHTNPFREQDAQYAQNRVVRLPVATNSSLELAKVAKKALHDIYKLGYNYKKAGVIVSAIVPENEVQQSLFETTNPETHTRVMKAMDAINMTYGRSMVKVAAQGSGQAWKLRQEKLSPCYTTQWDDIITIKV